MKKALKKIAAAALAATTLVSGMAAVTANAYISKRSWNVFIVSTPYAPGQHRSYSCSMNAYTGGYIARCSSMSGSIDRSVSISGSYYPVSWTFTTTGTGGSKKSNNNVNGLFYFNVYGYGSEIVANGDIGYDM
ncbi:MAG: hypothetical protein IKH27_09615 [Oscillospiraceae bacterium]|nr:hypothetical protein [Oscillospiraceae bacterium]